MGAREGGPFVALGDRDASLTAWAITLLSPTVRRNPPPSSWSAPKPRGSCRGSRWGYVPAPAALRAGLRAALSACR
jgi:hypothetical protein